jgi:hypothetical protein
MSKSFTHAGVSRLNGKMKVRFANDALRIKVLAKNGHKDIDMLELKHPMNKDEAVAYLISIDFATQNGKTNPDVKAALEAEQGKRSESEPKAKVAKVAKAKTVKPVAKAKPSLESIKAKAAKPAKVTVPADAEDAPF